WAMQYIPSGWVSLLYGFMPIATALMARIWLKGETLSGHRLFGMAVGFFGLASIFSTGFNLNPQAALGIGAVLLSATMHAGSSVWVKKQKADIPAIVMTSGGLLVAAPLFFLMWLYTGADMPVHPSSKTLWSIGYLALFGSVLGFALYYYVLKHVEATKASLITLIAPVAALALGNTLNGEPLTVEIIAGAILILGGLAIFELGHRLPMFAKKP
ncbi:MAG: DMT family transporter, partial [Ghiorsea sp.]